MAVSEIIMDFLEDAREQVSRFESSLLKLEKDLSDSDSLNVLFRAAHSLKGSSYYTGFQHLGRFVHKIESLLEPVKKGESVLGKHCINMLFKVLDFIKMSLQAIQEKGEDVPVPPELENGLERAFANEEEKEDKTDSVILDFAPPDVKPISGEDSDAELFSIFIDTLHEQLKVICETIVFDDLSDEDERNNVLNNAFRRIINSSRYMDYEPLVRFFEGWQNLLSNLLAEHSDKKDIIDVSVHCVDYLSKVLPSLDSQSLMEILKAEGGKPYESARPFGEGEQISQELKIIDEELEAAFSRWIEDASRVEDAFEPDREETPEQEPLEEVGEAISSGSSLWEEIVEEEEAEFPVYREEIVVPDEIPVQPTEMLRVDPGKVDHLLNEVGELVIRRSHFVVLNSELKELAEQWYREGILDADKKKALDRLWQEYRDAVSLLGRITADLQDAVMKIRMLPLIQLFEKFPRIVRDHAAQYGKSVRMVIKGGETEVDRRIWEQLYEPLVHILRNAVAHGIEPPEVRKSLGKSEDGTITISAYYRGQHVIIEITDDGAGVPLDRLKKVLLEKGMFRPEEIERMSPEELLDTIFLPGVSTAIDVDETAGRGIGLDVVREECRKINGHVTVRSWETQGTQFIIQIPLTLAIIPGLLVKIKGDIYTLPLASVGEVYAFNEQKVKKVRNAYFLTLEDRTVPLIFPEYLFSRKVRDHDKVGRGNYIVILRTPAKEAGLVVDQFLGQQEVVIKPIEDVMDVIHGYAGATILGDGTISLIIDVPAVIDYVEKLSFPG